MDFEKKSAQVTTPSGYALLTTKHKTQEGDLKFINGAWIPVEQGGYQIKLYSIPYARKS